MEFGILLSAGVSYVAGVEMVPSLPTALTGPNPKGPCTQYLGTWVLGNSSCSTGFG